MADHYKLPWGARETRSTTKDLPGAKENTALNDGAI